ncbi:unnamed protein product [Phytophthora fragariaefolia]|uniref:Unnamed protein product n=1 Tax=Phytophthora fragariaefolia TaxID=1490495 RepID=A0A9W6TK02_9STRA|nr:unnamed protein product [Phytophthora fragariaefolia]
MHESRRKSSQRLIPRAARPQTTQLFGKRVTGAMEGILRPGINDSPRYEVDESDEEEKVKVALAPDTRRKRDDQMMAVRWANGTDRKGNERTETTVEPDEASKKYVKGMTLVKQLMGSDAEDKDAARAAIYVATVRPAMPSNRFPMMLATTAGGMKEIVDGDGTENNDELDESNDDPKGEAPGDDEIAQARAAQRKARKSAKRARVKVLLARKRSMERKREEERQRMSNERLTERQQASDEAMKALKEQQRQHVRDEGECQVEQHGTLARVRLVQHRADEAERRVAAGETVEYLGADDGLPTAIMEVVGTRRQVKLDSGASEGTGEARVVVVRMMRRTAIDGCAVTPVEVAVATDDGEIGIVFPTKYTGAVMLAATVTKVRNDKVIVPVVNAKNEQARLPMKPELGKWIPIDSSLGLLEMRGELRRERISEWLDGLGGSDVPLDAEQDVNIGTEDDHSRQLVLKLLHTYRKLTVDTGDCPPAIVLSTEHHIDTGDAGPIMLKRRRQAQSEDAVVETNVRKMLAAGVIEEGNFAWGFPVVLVRKKDGKVRFCVDYRALNKITTKTVDPLPRIDETLEALGSALLFSTLDLKAGYWQIRVANKDNPKTAFTTKQGLYQFDRMPFGLTNAPSTFQRLMNNVLRGLTWTTCLAYLDDIVVYTRRGIERHELELACVLERLSAAGLTLKLKQCVSAAQRMEYLGHKLSADGVRSLDRIVSAVRDFPQPRDAVKEFDFDVQYSPGTTNVVVDALSRAPVTATVLAAIGRRRRAKQHANAAAKQTVVKAAVLADTTYSGSEQGQVPEVDAARQRKGDDNDARADDEHSKGGNECRNNDLLEGHGGHESSNVPADEQHDIDGGAPSRRKRVSWSPNVVDDTKRTNDRAVTRYDYAKRHTGDKRRTAGSETGIRVPDTSTPTQHTRSIRRSDASSISTKAAMAPKTSTVRARMTRREALKRTPAESREVPVMLNEDVQSPNEEAAPSSEPATRKRRVRESPMNSKYEEENDPQQRKGVLGSQQKAGSESPRIGPILGSDGVATDMASAEIDGGRQVVKRNSEVDQYAVLETLQLTDNNIAMAQKRSRLIQR